jgi:hypothetical protein
MKIQEGVRKIITEAGTRDPLLSDSTFISYPDFSGRLSPSEHRFNSQNQLTIKPSENSLQITDFFGDFAKPFICAELRGEESAKPMKTQESVRKISCESRTRYPLLSPPGPQQPDL